MSDNARYFVKYKNHEPMDTMRIQNEQTGSDGDSDYTYNAPLRPVDKEMIRILIEQGWMQVKFIEWYDAHTKILKSVHPGLNLWKRQGEECARRRIEGTCISYADLLNLAKQRIKKRKQG